MNKFSEIFENLKERLNNPFFLAFIISWIFWNWEVSVALIWYDPVQIEKEGYKSLFAFIRYNTSTCKSIIAPILSAFLYTTLLRLILTGLNDLVTRFSEALSIRILRDSSVSMTKFLTLREANKKQAKQLEEIIKDENKTIENFEKEKVVRLEVEHKNISLQKANSELDKYIRDLFDMVFLNGNWSVIRDSDGAKTTTYIEVQSGQVFVYNGSFKEQKYQLSNYIYNTRTKQIFFVMNQVWNNSEPRKIRKIEKEGTIYIEEGKLDQILINILDVRDSNTLVGTENSTTQITYTRN